MQKNYEEIIREKWMDKEVYDKFIKALEKKKKRIYSEFNSNKIHPLFGKWLSTGKI